MLHKCLFLQHINFFGREKRHIIINPHVQPAKCQTWWQKHGMNPHQLHIPKGNLLKEWVSIRSGDFWWKIILIRWINVAVHEVAATTWYSQIPWQMFNLLHVAKASKLIHWFNFFWVIYGTENNYSGEWDIVCLFFHETFCDLINPLRSPN